MVCIKHKLKQLQTIPMAKNSYIIRVYEQPVSSDDENQNEDMAGIVEEVDTGVKHAFHNRDELWHFMSEHQGKMPGQFKT